MTSPMEDHRSASGVPCGAITGLLAATQKRLVRRYYTSPLAIAGIGDSLAKYYTIMRLAIPRDVAWMVTANPATLLVLARTADDHRERLIRDIHDGTLTPEMPVALPIKRFVDDHTFRRSDDAIGRTLIVASQCFGIGIEKPCLGIETLAGSRFMRAIGL